MTMQNTPNLSLHRWGRVHQRIAHQAKPYPSRAGNLVH